MWMLATTTEFFFFHGFSFADKTRLAKGFRRRCELMNGKVKLKLEASHLRAGVRLTAVSAVTTAASRLTGVTQ
jgi:hypothetical protein